MADNKWIGPNGGEAFPVNADDEVKLKADGWKPEKATKKEDEKK